MSRQFSSPFDPSKYVKQGVSLQRIQQIKSAFDLFDIEQSGYVNIKQLQAAMRQWGFQARNNSIFKMISQIDSDGNGNIDFDQWLSLTISKTFNTNTRAHYSRVFSLYDDQCTGFITSKNIKRVAQDLGMTLSDKEIQQLIARADLDQDGMVGEEEFYHILTYRK